MQRSTFFGVVLLLICGCSAIRDLSSYHMRDGRGVLVMGAFGEPASEWQCRKVGKEGYDPGDKTIFGVEISKDDNDEEAELRKRKYFVYRAIKYEANYIDMPGSQSSGFGDLYRSSDKVYADYYQCQNLPEPS